MGTARVRDVAGCLGVAVFVLVVNRCYVWLADVNSLLAQAVFVAALVLLVLWVLVVRWYRARS